MKLFRKREKDSPVSAVQTAYTAPGRHSAASLLSCCCGDNERQLYRALVESVPLIAAALEKIVRLVGSFEVKLNNRSAEKRLNSFLQNVRVGAAGHGVGSFISSYLMQLLVYGTAVGEVVPYSDASGIAALYNASLDDVELRQGKSPLELEIYSRRQRALVKNSELILHTALNPKPGRVYGTSVLKGLPFVSDILLKIFNTIGENWERVGNVRFSVSCSCDGANAKERAKQIAEQWSLAMGDKHSTRDFVSVGDVDIKVIGADNQILDSEVPVRQLLEQIVAKLGIPPFLLGLNWSSTERMAQQQCDILTSELEWYRALLNPVIEKICRIYLYMSGVEEETEIIWNSINLQDETELAQARLWTAQARQIEQSLEEDEK